jgi:hypothetical protein
MAMQTRTILTTMLVLLCTSCAQQQVPEVEQVRNGVIPVEVVQRDGRYLLLRDGQPYQVRGAGVEYDHIASFAAHGGNSFRTWSTADGQRFLDAAEEHGLTVILCIDVGRERLGFDYDDREAVAKQLEFARAEVLKYRDHPALLAWMIGNEPNLEFENPRVFDAIDQISRMIHEVDGAHPTTTALAGFSGELANLVEQRAPDLDFLSFQVYGDAVNLPQYIRQTGYDRPYMVTEWGAPGHWEVATTGWRAPIEQASSEKAENFEASFEALSSNGDQLLGNYVFLWGQKQERTPTWYGMFIEDGSKTEAVDVMHYIWNGEWPENRAPRVRAMRLDAKTAYGNITVAPGGSYVADVLTFDPDGDALRYYWEIMRESRATQTGGDAEETPEILRGLVRSPGGDRAVVNAPQEPGGYRLFVYVFDGNGNAGHANIPFRVERPEAGRR